MQSQQTGHKVYIITDFEDVEMNKISEDLPTNVGYNNFFSSTLSGREFLKEPKEIKYDAIFENLFEVFGHYS